jgi:hypothetical protein
MFALVAGFFFTSCNQPEVKVRSAEEHTAGFSSGYQLPEKLKGVYSGDFKGSPISITLHFISGNRITGYNIHQGLKRNLTGTVTPAEKGWKLILDEPGNNTFDGRFELTLDTTSWKGSGIWDPLKKGDQVSFRFSRMEDNKEPGSIFSAFIDSLQNTFVLAQDGSCSMNVLRGDSANTQAVTIRGNYKIGSDSTLTIFWQKNEIFPSRKSTFRLYSYEIGGDGENDFRLYGIRGEGREFNQMYD